MTEKTYPMSAIVAAFGALLTMALEGGDAITEALGGDNSEVDVTGKLDSAGFPWDERIHSGKKTTKADGTWTYKKGASALIAGVEAELRAKGFGVTTPAPAAPVVTAPVVTTPAPAAPVVTTPALTITPPAPVVAPKTEYEKLCDLIAANTAQLNPAWLQSLFESNGVPGGLPALAGDEVRSKAFHDGILTVLPRE